MSPEESFLARLRADPDASAKRIAGEVGISSRAARRLVAQLEAEGVRRSRLKVRAGLSGGLVGALAIVGYLLAPGDAPSAPPAVVALSSEVKAKERELYAALDTKDPARVAEAKEELANPQEAVRLAALRYLAALSSSDHAKELVPLFEDPSDRVRTVALRLVGGAPGAEVEAALVRVLLRRDRALAERLLAVSCLRERAPSEHLAAEVLPVLLDGSQILRKETAQLLAQLTREQVDVGAGAATDPEVLHAAWREALGISE